SGELGTTLPVTNWFSAVEVRVTRWPVSPRNRHISAAVRASFQRSGDQVWTTWYQCPLPAFWTGTVPTRCPVGPRKIEVLRLRVTPTVPVARLPPITAFSPS